MTAFPPETIEALRTARKIGVVTGAGISVASGIRAYRGSGGVYDDPEEGDRLLEALNGRTLRSDPQRTWSAVRALALEATSARPNAGHHALVHLAERGPRTVLLTQNVDGLHELAGSPEIIEIHGTMRRLRCDGCRSDRPFAAWEEHLVPPTCDDCQGALRPDVVLFDEMLPPRAVDALERDFLVDPPDCVLAVGTTALFPYIEAAILQAALRGGHVLEVNPEETVVSKKVSATARAPAHEALPALVEAAFPRPVCG